MFIIDLSRPEDEIRSVVSNLNSPDWAAPVVDFVLSWLDESVNGFPVHTSGSTDRPKLIYHSRKAIIASAERTCTFFSLKKGDTSLLALPATHIGGKMMIVRSIIRGLKMICTEPRSNPIEHMHFDGKIAFAAFTPMQMSAMMDAASSRAELSQISKIILGGGEVSYPLRQRLQGLPSAIFETYGMTETISHIALKRINGPDSSDYFKTFDQVSITSDERGCLVIDAPDLCADSIVTNDLVNIISNNEFRWLGRYDNIINTGGIKVSAEEIERKLQPYIGVNFFVAGINDEVLGQKVSLILEGEKPGLSDESVYRDVLGKYERPRQVLSISEFSYTANGKINKKETLNRLIPK